MPRILCLHRLATENIGDLNSCPADYFPQLAGAERLDIFGYHLDEAGTEAATRHWYEAVSAADVIVIGGGGLLNCEFFQPCLATVEATRRPASRVVLWGCGHNAAEAGYWDTLKPGLDFGPLEPSLVGIRDVGYTERWVPCASVMSPLLDPGTVAEHDVVVYAHHARQMGAQACQGQLGLPDGTPLLLNNTTFAATVDFLRSGDLVLTDSYHGALWATMLGRRVVASPTSSKFFSLRHPVPLCAPEDWRNAARLVRAYPDALAEAREAALEFAADFERVLE